MSRKSYSRDFKVGAVKQVIDENKTVSKVANKLSIIPIMLSRWI